MSMSALALAAAAGVYPAEQVLSSFRTGCVEQTSFSSTKSSVEKFGWVSVKPTAGSKLDVVVEAGKRTLSELGMTPTMHVYSRSIAGRPLNLVLTSGTVPFDGRPSTMTNCNIYDFEADGGLSPAALRKWAGREPAQTIVEGGPVSEWAPGLSQVPSKTRISFTPTIKTGDALHLGGLVFSSTIVEENK